MVGCCWLLGVGSGGSGLRVCVPRILGVTLTESECKWRSARAAALPQGLLTPAAHNPPARPTHPPPQQVMQEVLFNDNDGANENENV